MRRWQSYCVAGALAAFLLMGARVSFGADENAAPKTNPAAVETPQGPQAAPEKVAAEKVAPETVTPKIDPKAAETLKALADYFAGLKSVSVDASLNMNVEGPGVKQQVAIAYLIAAERPNKLAMVEKESTMGVTVVCDGKQIYTYFPMMKMYTVKDAPADMDAIWSQSQQGSEKLLFIDALLHNKPYESMMQGIEEAKYVGEEDVDGVKTDHVNIVTPDFQSDIWMTKGEKPTLVKVVPDMMKMLSKAGGMGEMKDMKMSVIITFKNWQLDTTIPAAAFAFEPPKDAKKVNDFASAMSEEAAPEKPVILGKTAGDFKLELLGGGQLDLAAVKGKNVVILYFWATWPDGCEKAVPILQQLMDGYKGKNVVLFAVNEQEDEAKIQEFMKKTNATYAVALDKDGLVGEQYSVDGLPETVVIGLDGTVQAVHPGFIPTMKDDLTKEIDQLLAGNKLENAEQVTPEVK